jgi:hypothetical protein
LTAAGTSASTEATPVELVVGVELALGVEVAVVLLLLPQAAIAPTVSSITGTTSSLL